MAKMKEGPRKKKTRATRISTRAIHGPHSPPVLPSPASAPHRLSQLQPEGKGGRNTACGGQFSQTMGRRGEYIHQQQMESNEQKTNREKDRSLGGKAGHATSKDKVRQRCFQARRRR